jgi:alkanesulfonate monooxygenase SsuD/methylene tetrahydromethanopterin reductase-like flavin-dependent oxidoreductase (luciferase family)
MVGGAGEKYLLKVVAKYADRYNLYFGTPQKMERKINILKDYNTKNREIEYSIVLPCLIVDNDEEIENIVKKMKKGNMTINQFKKSVAGGLTLGTIDDIINGISQYVNIGVTHFIFHFLHLDQRVLKKFSRIVRVASSKNNLIASI